MGRSWQWLTVAGLLLAGGAVAFWFLALEPIRVHREWSNRVEADLKSLAGKRPADITLDEWESLVGWTLNLHGNCGVHYAWVDRAEREPFLAELERRLQGPVSVATIDWIWDEYARITKYGQTYSDKFRPTRSAVR